MIVHYNIQLFGGTIKQQESTNKAQQITTLTSNFWWHCSATARFLAANSSFLSSNDLPEEYISIWYLIFGICICIWIWGVHFNLVIVFVLPEELFSISYLIFSFAWGALINLVFVFAWGAVFYFTCLVHRKLCKTTVWCQNICINSCVLCCALLALSWNTTKKDPNADKLSRAIN